MGCVQSQEEERDRRRRQRQRRSPDHRPSSHHQPQQRQSNGYHTTGNGYSRKTSQDPVYENVSPNRSNGSNGVRNNVDDDENQFRRQQFDRNSCLRHSKKRKKSVSGSNPNSPAGATTPGPKVSTTSNGFPAKEAVTKTEPSRTGQTNSGKSSPITSNDNNNDNFKPEVFTYEFGNVNDSIVSFQPEEVFKAKTPTPPPPPSQPPPDDEPKTASSIVAAILAADSAKQVNPDNHSTVSSTTTTNNKLSKSEFVNGTSNRNQGRQGGSRPVSTSGSQANRVVLRTRRQLEEEEEQRRQQQQQQQRRQQQQQQKVVEPSDEDCGRLI